MAIVNAPLLEVRQLCTGFETPEHGRIRVVDDVSFVLDEGEALALVGESGCGKTVCALSLLRLIPEGGVIESGQILFRGKNLLTLSDKQLRHIRGREIGIVFQEPTRALNPVWSIGFQVEEAIRAHEALRRSESRKRAIECLGDVGIPAPDLRFDDYPHQMSGGLLQRVMIAIALASRPAVLIADEPTTSLDVTVQAQIMQLLRDLQESQGLAILLISHDLGVVAELADHVAVMYAARIVESSPARDLFRRPRHPYTEGLFRSLPPLDKRLERLEAIPGAVPNPERFPSGCRFHDRCSRADEVCRQESPPLDAADSKHQVACHFPL